jgi:hypothetical protein
MKKNLAYLLLLLAACTNNDLEGPFDCGTVSISVSLVSSANVTSCTESNGSLSVSATGGKEPYTFSVNGGAFVTSGVFQNLASGSYTVVAKDANGCQATLLPSPTLTNTTSTLTATVESGIDTGCTTDNGSLSVTAQQGTPPYQYKLGTQNFGSASSFANLAAGNYTIIVKDNAGCTFTVNKTIARGDTGVSWSSEVQSIITNNCATSGCHNGNQSPNLSSLSGVQNNKDQVKSRTANNSMPPSGRTPLTAEQKAKIACWVDDGAKNN